MNQYDLCRLQMIPIGRWNIWLCYTIALIRNYFWIFSGCYSEHWLVIMTSHYCFWIFSDCYSEYWLVIMTLDCSVTLALPKSSQSRRIVAVDDIMPGLLSISSTVSFVKFWLRRKKICTSTTCTPELPIPFFKYSSALGICPEANHFASTRNASHKLDHCSNQHFLENVSGCYFLSNSVLNFIEVKIYGIWLTLTAFLSECRGL